MIEGIREDFCATEIGVARLGYLPQSGLPKILTFKLLELDGSKFSEWIDIKNKLNLTKVRVATMGVFPQTNPPKIKPFKLDT